MFLFDFDSHGFVHEFVDIKISMYLPTYFLQLPHNYRLSDANEKRNTNILAHYINNSIGMIILFVIFEDIPIQ